MSEFSYSFSFQVEFEAGAITLFSTTVVLLFYFMNHPFSPFYIVKSKKIESFNNHIMEASSCE